MRVGFGEFRLNPPPPCHGTSLGEFGPCENCVQLLLLYLQKDIAQLGKRPQEKAAKIMRGVEHLLSEERLKRPPFT